MSAKSMRQQRDEEKQIHAGTLEVFNALDRHGSIAVLGLDIWKYEEDMASELKKRVRIGQYRQSLILDGQVYTGLSVLDNILFHQRKGVFFLRRKEIERVKKLIREYGMKINLLQCADHIHGDNRRIVNLLSAFMAGVDCVIIKDCMADMSMNGTGIYCDILRKMKKDGCRIVYLTTRWEDAVKVAERVLLINRGEVEREYDADIIRSNPKDLVQLLGSGVYQNDATESSSFSQTMEAIIQSNEIIARNMGSNSMEEMTALLYKSLNANGGFIYLEKQGKPFEEPQSIHVLNYARLNSEMQKLSQGFCYWTVRDSYFGDLFVDRPDDFQSIIVVPILCRNEYLGFCGVWFDHVYLYSQENLLALTTLANEVAIMLETSRLMNRSLLLQESHHRIKNNLQMIISLLYIQKNQFKDNAQMADAVQATVGRIKSIASVHDAISKNRHGSGIISVKSIANCVLNMYRNLGIEYEEYVEELYVVQQFAASVALILNELLSNCQKHAFTGLEAAYPRKVSIEMKADGDEMVLRVRDNGVGMKKEKKEGSGLGEMILNTLVKVELKGEIKWKNARGTVAEVRLPMCDIFTDYIL